MTKKLIPNSREGRIFLFSLLAFSLLHAMLLVKFSMSKSSQIQVKSRPTAISFSVKAAKPKIVKKGRGINEKAQERKELTKNAATSSSDEMAVTHKYLEQIGRLIQQSLRYPLISIKRGERGSVYVQFSISRDGAITDIKLTKKLSYGRLNRAAVKAVMQVNKVFPIPSEIKDDLMVTSIRLSFIESDTQT